MSRIIAILVAAFGPAFAHAQDAFDEQFGSLAAFARFLVAVRRIVNLLIPVVLGIALLSFMWGLTRFIANAGDETAQKQAKRIMVGGVIGFTVMASIWGIVAFIQESLGIEQTVIEIPVSNSGAPAGQTGAPSGAVPAFGR